MLPAFVLCYGYHRICRVAHSHTHSLAALLIALQTKDENWVASIETVVQGRTETETPRVREKATSLQLTPTHPLSVSGSTNDSEDSCAAQSMTGNTCGGAPSWTWHTGRMKRASLRPLVES